MTDPQGQPHGHGRGQDDAPEQAHGDDEREDLAAGERQYTSADLTAHDPEHGEIGGSPD